MEISFVRRVDAARPARTAGFGQRADDLY